MYISLSGTHSTGKTTLLEEIKMNPLFDNFHIVESTTREAKSFGFSINEKGDLSTQLFCMSKDLLNIFQNSKSFLSQNNHVISDRCLLDTLVYTWYLYEEFSSIDLKFVLSVKEVVKQYVQKYDAIVLLTPEFKIVDDGVRSINEDFQKRVQELFEEFIKEFNLEDKILRVTGSVEERLDQIKSLYKFL